MAGERREGGSAQNGITIMIGRGGLRKSSKKKRRKMPSKAKARKILKDKEVRGKPLTKAQRGFFGLRAAGKTPERLKPR